MELKEKIQAANFANPNMKKALLGLAELETDFKAKKGMTIFRSILLTLSQSFPEDKDQINSLFYEQSSSKPTPHIKMREIKISADTDHNDTGKCDGCTEERERKLTDSTTVEEVKEYFIGGVGEEEGIKKMVNYLMSNAIKTSNAHKKNSDYLAKKIFEFIKSPVNIIQDKKF